MGRREAAFFIARECLFRLREFDCEWQRRLVVIGIPPALLRSGVGMARRLGVGMARSSSGGWCDFLNNFDVRESRRMVLSFGRMLERIGREDRGRKTAWRSRPSST
jgi:hypothetical protein